MALIMRNKCKELVELEKENRQLKKQMTSKQYSKPQQMSLLELKKDQGLSDEKSKERESNDSQCVKVTHENKDEILNFLEQVAKMKSLLQHLHK